MEKVRRPDKVIRECLLYPSQHDEHDTQYEEPNDDDYNPSTYIDPHEAELDWIYEQMINACIEESKEESKEPIPLSEPYENPILDTLIVKIKRLYSIENDKETKEIYKTILMSIPKNDAHVHRFLGNDICSLIQDFNPAEETLNPHLPIPPNSNAFIPISIEISMKEKIDALLKTIRFTKEEKQLLKEIFP